MPILPLTVLAASATYFPSEIILVGSLPPMPKITGICPLIVCNAQSITVRRSSFVNVDISPVVPKTTKASTPILICRLISRRRAGKSICCLTLNGVTNAVATPVKIGSIFWYMYVPKILAIKYFVDMQNLWYTQFYMNKTRAIIKYCVICVIVALAVVLCFAEFTIPFTNTKYVGCYQAIKNKMGIDLNGGVLAVYTATPADNSVDLDAEVDATINRIKNTLSQKGYLEAAVIKQGTNPNYKIRIEVPGMSDTEEIMDAIGTPANIEFLEPTSDQSAAQNYDATKVFLTGEGIAGVKVVSDPEDASNYAIQLTFTAEGKSKFREKVQSAGGQYLAIFSNKNLISAPQITTENAGTLGSDGKVLITGKYTKEGADEFALKIESGLYTVGLEISQMSYIPATLGEGAIMAGLIALAIGLLLIFILMIVVYRDFGLIANLSLIIYTVDRKSVV